MFCNRVRQSVPTTGTKHIQSTQPVPSICYPTALSKSTQPSILTKKVKCILTFRLSDNKMAIIGVNTVKSIFWQKFWEEWSIAQIIISQILMVIADHSQDAKKSFLFTTAIPPECRQTKTKHSPRRRFKDSDCFPVIIVVAINVSITTQTGNVFCANDYCR